MSFLKFVIFLPFPSSDCNLHLAYIQHRQFATNEIEEQNRAAATPCMLLRNIFNEDTTASGGFTPADTPFAEILSQKIRPFSISTQCRFFKVHPLPEVKCSMAWLPIIKPVKYPFHLASLLMLTRY